MPIFPRSGARGAERLPVSIHYNISKMAVFRAPCAYVRVCTRVSVCVCVCKSIRNCIRNVCLGDRMSTNICGNNSGMMSMV